MSECVVRMEMPENCFNCDLRYECNAFYAPGKPKPFMKGCRIVCQLPEGHGDLIDRDALLGTCIYYYINPNKGAVDADNILDMPVIIAAERR